MSEEKFECDICGKFYTSKRGLRSHKLMYHLDEMESNYKCELCGTKFDAIGRLQQHLGKCHKDINQEDYYKQYLLKDNSYKGECLYCKDKTTFQSYTDGYAKFCYNKDCNVRWYNENSDRKEQAAKSLSETFKNNPDKVTTNIEYWIKKGYSEEDAKLKVKERQSTFTKEKCIEKYGEVEGLKRWQDRQDKWQNTLNSKSDEERKRITEAKLNNLFTKGFSKISQELFWGIYDKIMDKYKPIYFATNDNGVECGNTNKEFILVTKTNTRLLDFYIPEIEKCIEFDGDYWHGEKRGNQERDRIREEDIKKYGIKIYHVKEKDYRENKEKVINECLEFLHG